MKPSQLKGYFITTITENLQYDNLILGSDEEEDNTNIFGDDEFEFTDCDGERHRVKILMDDDIEEEE